MTTLLAGLPSGRTDIVFDINNNNTTNVTPRWKSIKSTKPLIKPPKLSISLAQRVAPAPSSAFNCVTTTAVTTTEKLHSAIEPHNYRHPYQLSCHQRTPSNGNNSRSPSPNQRAQHQAQIQQHYDAGNVSIETIYSSGPKVIVPNLYLGSEKNAKDLDKMIDLGIGYVLNVAKEVTLGVDVGKTNQATVNNNNPNQNQELLTSSPGKHSNPSPHMMTTPATPHDSIIDEKSSESSDIAANDSLLPQKTIISTPPSVIYKHLPWTHEEFIIASLPTAFEFIEEARKNNRAILINCQQGISRSASLVIAYVMKSSGMRAWEAYDYVKERAAHISPNIQFMGQLVEFEKWCVVKKKDGDFLCTSPGDKKEGGVLCRSPRNKKEGDVSCKSPHDEKMAH